ncbi:MAG: hypothetical protein PUP93_34000 [Rhizonema sp. NSF051]|nr:hypothetical protein [Rhizonema sp. NSF051]
MNTKNKDAQYRYRYSVDLKEYEEIILRLAEAEGRGKANMVKQLIREALLARNEIVSLA